MPFARQNIAAVSNEVQRHQFKTFLERKGLRVTSQRMAILEASFGQHEHFTAEQLLAQARRIDDSVSRATVYRTLKLLAECGVALERRFGDGLTRYELADEESHHDHLICVECDKILEFEEARIEALQEEIANKYGYILKSHKHEMYGVCPECQAKAGRPRRAP